MNFKRSPRDPNCETFSSCESGPPSSPTDSTPTSQIPQIVKFCRNPTYVFLTLNLKVLWKISGNRYSKWVHVNFQLSLGTQPTVKLLSTKVSQHDDPMLALDYKNHLKKYFSWTISRPLDGDKVVKHSNFLLLKTHLTKLGQTISENFRSTAYLIIQNFEKKSISQLRHFLNMLVSLFSSQ